MAATGNTFGLVLVCTVHYYTCAVIFERTVSRVLLSVVDRHRFDADPD